MAAMFTGGEKNNPLYEEYKEEYNSKMDGEVTGAEANEALYWWDDHPGFDKFKPEFEQKKLNKIIATYAEVQD